MAQRVSEGGLLLVPAMQCQTIRHVISAREVSALKSPLGHNLTAETKDSSVLESDDKRY